MNYLPDKYNREIEKLKTFLHEHYPNQLKLITLTGSAAYGKIIEDISDLDFLIMLDVATPDDYRKIMSFKKELTMKVDIIIISERQVKHLYLDYNSVYYLYLLKIGHIKPIYINDNLEINISKKVMFSFIKNILSLNIRTLKRLVYDEESMNSYMITKYASYVVKNYLILNETFAENIEITFNEFNKISRLEFPVDIKAALSNSLNKDDFNLLVNFVDKIVLFMDTITTEELMLDENGSLFDTLPR